MQPICLITPPSIFLLDERVYINLGILKVAAVLEKAGYPIEMIDLSGIENYTDVVEVQAGGSSARLYGITATTPQMPATIKIVQAIRRVRPQARIILGGPHVTLVHAAYRKELKAGKDGRATRAFRQLESTFDVLVVGDGERAIVHAIRDDAPKLVDGDDPRSDLFLTNRMLEETPWPARHLVNVPSYRYHIEQVPAITIIAQLGCPFSCGFCGGRESAMLRRVRTRSSRNVVDEMVYLYKTYGMRGFMFFDDELNVNTKMVELMNLIEKTQKGLGVEFRLRGSVKSQLFTDEQADAMYRAGFRWVLTGFESGSPRILDNIDKKATREQNTRCVQIAKRHNLKIKALMSIGHPGESEETVRETKQWLLDIRPNDFDFTIITTYAGTPYYDFAEPVPGRPDHWVYACPRSKDKLYSLEVDYTQVADYYKGDPDGGYSSYVYTDDLTREDLVRLRDDAERDVRKRLGIPFYPSAAAVRYEHSMGQMGGRLPINIFKTSESIPAT